MHVRSRDASIQTAKVLCKGCATANAVKCVRFALILQTSSSLLLPELRLETTTVILQVYLKLFMSADSSVCRHAQLQVLVQQDTIPDRSVRNPDDESPSRLYVRGGKYQDEAAARCTRSASSKHPSKRTYYSRRPHTCNWAGGLDGARTTA